MSWLDEFYGHYDDYVPDEFLQPIEEFHAGDRTDTLHHILVEREKELKRELAHHMPLLEHCLGENGQTYLIDTDDPRVYELVFVNQLLWKGYVNVTALQDRYLEQQEFKPSVYGEAVARVHDMLIVAYLE